MVTTIHDSRPTSILDLGAGQGILLSAASERWRQAKLYGADLDADKVGLLAVRLPQAVCRQLDALKQNLPKLIGLDEGSVDLALCNPPYGRRPLGRRGTALLQGAGLAGCIATERITEDILFIAQNLRLLRDGGELAVIVPDGFATGHHYRDFRAALLERHALHRVLALPSDLFRGTEARTHVLFLKKNKGAATETVLEGFQGHQISISPKQAVEEPFAQSLTH
jgi:methylase of polypeptide subunit release factors